MWWWEASPNYNNTNNFCNVNTSGGASNNNASSSGAVAPDLKVIRSYIVTICEEKAVLKGGTFPVTKDIFVQNSQPHNYGVNSDASARTPLKKEVHGGESAITRFMCSEQSRLDSTLQDVGTEGEMINMTRRSKRRKKRKARRINKIRKRCESLGSIEGVFTYNALYRAGKMCCKGVRWKHSVQTFEARLFSGTAVRRRDLINGNFKFSQYVHFTICERGKCRQIDAPRIQDRQVEKVFTKKVLLPLYLPSMVYNNGASMPGKGFHFSLKMLRKDILHHFRRYGYDGGIMLADGRKFFPSANHERIYELHRHFITDDRLREFADLIISANNRKCGMPLGVEPSQAEMVAYPSAMDNYMAAQCRLHSGHYMDDFYAFVPPGTNHKEVLDIMLAQAERCMFSFNESKTKYILMKKPFRYCKAKFIITDSGRIIMRANKDSVPRDRRKLRAFKHKVDAGKMTYEDLRVSVNGMMAYLSHYNEHNAVLELRRLFFKLFGFSCEHIEEFRKREEKYAAIHSH